MTTRNLVLLLIPLVVLAGFFLSIRQPVQDDTSVSSGLIYNPDVDRVVAGFGRAMKSVSALAPKEELGASMRAAYGEYVAPEIIGLWLESPSVAPGRQTSSPWPDRINVFSMEGDRMGFVVNGTVVEVATGSGGAEEVVGTYSVKLRLQNRGGTWLITSFEKGDYSRLPARATIVGTYTCLPHRDSSGPQTMECAFGVREEGSGLHFAVNTQLMSSTVWMDIPTGERMRIEGVVTPIENLSTDHWQKYDIVGIIEATMIEKL